MNVVEWALGSSSTAADVKATTGQQENASGRVTHSSNGNAGWTVAHLTEQGGRELLERKNREAGDASDGLVSCTVQICAAHTPQTFLETRLLQSDDLGFCLDQVCMCCSFGVVIQVGPTNAACLTSTNPPPVSVKYPRLTLRAVLCCLPIGFRSLDCTMEGFASLARDPSVLTGRLVFPHNAQTK